MMPGASREAGRPGPRLRSLEFYRLLSEHGFAVIDYPDEELDNETQPVDTWQAPSPSSPP